MLLSGSPGVASTRLPLTPVAGGIFGCLVFVRWISTNPLENFQYFSLMLIAYIIIETEPQIGQFLQAALLLPVGKRPKKAKKPDCVPIWWLSGHITAKKSQIWLDISQISSTFEQLQLARAAAAALCAPSKRQVWSYMALLRRYRG